MFPLEEVVVKSILYKVIKKEEQDKFKIEDFSFENFVKEQLKKSDEEERNVKEDSIKKKMEVERDGGESVEKFSAGPVVSEHEKQELLKKAYEEGKEKGYREGFEKGMKEAEDKIKSLIEEYKKSLSSLNSLREKIYEEAQSEMILIVKEALKKIVAAEIKSSEEFILNVIKETIKNVVETKKIVIKVSPEDYRYLTENRDKVDSSLSGKEIELVEDPAITRGGCIIQTDMGEIDSTVETKLEEVLNILEEKNE